MSDQQQKNRSGSPTSPADDGGTPTRPDVDKPDVKDLLRRMRKVDPDQAKRYRQRTGQ
jgi:hypothetical protein